MTTHVVLRVPLALTGLAVAMRAIITRGPPVGALRHRIIARERAAHRARSTIIHRVPIEPFLILLAAVGAVSLATGRDAPGQPASNSR